MTIARRWLFAALLLVSALAIHTPASAARPSVLLGGYPVLRQQHSLTCESSAASMGTRGVITESQLMSVIPRRPNPNFGFRGNPNGEQGTALVDYGVYSAPVHKALLHFGFDSDVLQYSTDADLRAYVDRGWPVVTWVTYGLQKAKPRLAIHGGQPFVLVPHEHAVLMIGYDSTSIYVNDPWDRKTVRYLWPDFNRAWGYFSNMALAIEPCPAPRPVTGLEVSINEDGAIAWSWTKGAGAAHYDVTITRHMKADKTVFHAVQDGTTATVSSPKPGALYEISVTGISSCGATSTPVRLAIQIAAAPVTPTATPSVTTIPDGNSTPTVSPTATATTTKTAPAPTATPKP